MTSTGFTICGTGENNADAGDIPWSNPDRITAVDSSSATVTTDTSQYLVGRNFGFAIPFGHAIDGISVKFLASESGVGSLTYSLQLQDASGALFGAAQTVSVNGIALTEYTVGSSSDLWSAALSRVIANDADFGIRLWCTPTLSTSVDWVKMSVDYSASPPGQGVVLRCGGVI